MRIRPFLVRTAVVAAIATAGIGVAGAAAQANPSIDCAHLIAEANTDYAFGTLHYEYARGYLQDGNFDSYYLEVAIGDTYFNTGDAFVDTWERNCQVP